MSNRPGGKWMCPICGRNFARKNQSHSCELYSIKDHHLKKALPLTVQLYRELISQFQKFGPILVESLKYVIVLKKNSQFCSIKIQKTALKIIFRSFSLFSTPRLNLLPQSQQEDQYYYYQFKIQNLEDLDEELIDWFHQAYSEN